MKVDEQTLRQFADGGKTLMDASIYFGVPYNSMSNWCKKYGISFRGNGGPAKERAPTKPKTVQPDRKAPPGKVADLYRQVVEIRQHMRRLAHKERILLEEISKATDGEDLP